MWPVLALGLQLAITTLVLALALRRPVDGRRWVAAKAYALVGLGAISIWMIAYGADVRP